MSSTKLKGLGRSLGLVPKQYQPVSPGMERIARQQDRAPVPDHGQGIGEALKQMIDQTVQERVSGALEQQRQQLARQPPMPMPVSPPIKKRPEWIESTVTRRDHLGRIMWIDTTAEGSDLVLRTEVVSRNELGQICRSRTAPLPAEQGLPALPFQAEGRFYREPGKIYGNHLVDQDEN